MIRIHKTELTPAEYKRIGSWHEACGGYIQDSECIPSWKIWAIAVLYTVIFFGILPLLGYVFD